MKKLLPVLAALLLITASGCGPSQLAVAAIVGASAAGGAAAAGAGGIPPGDKNKPPSVTIVSGPDNSSTDITPTFQWTGTDPDGEVTCFWFRIDANPFSQTTNTSWTFPPISPGGHTFEIFTVDNDNGTSETVPWIWTIVSGVCDNISVPITVAIAGGTFTMGDSIGDGGIAEKPAHQVTVSDFEISTTPVTNYQFAEFLSAGYGTYYYPGEYQQITPLANGTFITDMGKEDYPAVYVTWEAASAYCTWLTQCTDNSWRLPTEAEWEYACRGGLSGKKYAFGGDLLESQANYRDSCFDYKTGEYPWTTPIGLLENNGYGLYDIAGNVWEWCSDYYCPDYYQECDDFGTVIDPTGPDTGTAKVLRGGSWDSGLYALRCSFRFYKAPSSTDFTIGFRCVKTSGDD